MRAELRALLAVLLLVVCVDTPAKVYLVSVGISDYPGTDGDLALPVSDAKTIAWLYGKNGTEVECKLLVDSQATSDNILGAIKTVFSGAGADDIVVFFFSGHGYPGGFAAYDAALSYARIRKAMAACVSENKMIFADACYSGKIRTPGRNTASDVAEAQKANVLLFLSSRSGETSIERRNMKNGFFTTYLQKGLRGGADVNRDRKITARELFTYVHDGVVRLSDNKQHPVMWGNFSDDMPVMVW